MSETWLHFDLVDSPHRRQVLEAARRLHLRVAMQDDQQFAVEVLDAMSAYRLGRACDPEPKKDPRVFEGPDVPLDGV